jgi:hypothetical protein
MPIFFLSVPFANDFVNIKRNIDANAHQKPKIKHNNNGRAFTSKM